MTDNYTELALGGALVQVLDSEIKGYTDDQGNFVLANVPPGEKTIRISYLGYDPISKSVSVPSDGIARVDASFATSAIELEAFRVQGSLVGTARALNSQRAAD